MPNARILWTAEIDPGTLTIDVAPASSTGDDAIDLARLVPWLTVVSHGATSEHAVLSDGWRRIRLDILGGTLREASLVLFAYRLRGLQSLAPQLTPLRRLVALCQTGRFAVALHPPERRMARWTDLLRVADARADGASYRDIAVAMVGEERVRRDWHDAGRSLHSNVRRLVAGAAAMAAGGYRSLLRPPAMHGRSRVVSVEDNPSHRRAS